MRATQLSTQTKLDTLTSLPPDMAVIKERLGMVNGRLRAIEVWKERTFGAMAVLTLLMGSGIVGLVITFLVRFGGQ